MTEFYFTRQCVAEYFPEQCLKTYFVLVLQLMCLLGVWCCHLKKEEAQSYQSINDLFEFPAFRSQKPHIAGIKWRLKACSCARCYSPWKPRGADNMLEVNAAIQPEKRANGNLTDCNKHKCSCSLLSKSKCPSPTPRAE